mgnify:CR=1 FL=1
MIVFGSDARCLGSYYAVLQDAPEPPTEFLAGMLSAKRDYADRLLGRGLLRAEKDYGGDIRPALLAWQFASALVSGGSEFRSKVYSDGVYAQTLRFRGRAVSVWTLGDDAQTFPAAPADLSYAAFPTNAIQIQLRANPAADSVRVFDIYGRQRLTLRPDAAGLVSVTVERNAPVVVLGAETRQGALMPSDLPAIKGS